VAARRLLIGLDVDGTLIGLDESISTAVREQVARVQELGHEVTLATGRSWETAQGILEHFKLSPEYVVCSNGALIMQRDAAEPTGYRREWVETFDPTEVLQKIRGHLPRGSYMVEDATGFRRYTEGMTDWELSNAEQVDFDDLSHFPASRVVVVAPELDTDEFLEVVRGMGLNKVSYSIGWTAWLDIAPVGVNKGSALARVRDELGIPHGDVLVVGDGRNDLEMFEWAVGGGGRAYAMGQAPDELKAVATAVTGTVEDDGLAQVLSTL
jgi:HAD superfamily hydrolase (TIGR01484 family)